MPKRYLHGPMTWKVMQRNAWKLNKVATPCMDDRQFKEEENGSVGDYLLSAHKWFSIVYIWHALGDLIFHGL